MQKYYEKFPRDFDDDWPSKEPSDLKLRAFLLENMHARPAEVRKQAKEIFGIDLQV